VLASIRQFAVVGGTVVAVSLALAAHNPASPFVALRSSGDQLGGASFVAFAIARHTPDRTIPFL